MSEMDKQKCISRGQGDRCLTRHTLRQCLFAYNTIALALFFFFFFFNAFLPSNDPFPSFLFPLALKQNLALEGSLLSSYLYYLHQSVS